jgi:flavin reductase (DIM6/NTAB) family NADH-FMN oxidoreductase RutF
MSHYFIADPRKHGLKYSPFKALVAPRPIAWVSTVSADGVVNLAPYSFFNAVADNPPMIVFAPNNPRPGGGAKDTLTNLEQTGEFVVNLCSYDLREEMNASSAHVDPNVDEFELAGLTKAECHHVKVPRVAEAPAALECKFLFRTRLPSTSPKAENNVVFGEVLGMHIAENILKDGMVDMLAYQPLARLGYMDYSWVQSVFSMDRPDGDLASYEAAKSSRRAAE